MAPSTPEMTTWKRVLEAAKAMRTADDANLPPEFGNQAEAEDTYNALEASLLAWKAEGYPMPPTRADIMVEAWTNEDAAKHFQRLEWRRRNGLPPFPKPSDEA